jgi:predicted nucleic acid-binding protein
LIYIDTNAIVSYIDKADSNHERAMKLTKINTRRLPTSVVERNRSKA